MDRGGQAPRPASDIKHGKMAVVGLAGHIWPISNTPYMLLPRQIGALLPKARVGCFFPFLFLFYVFSFIIIFFSFSISFPYFVFSFLFIFL
jgi:hypothetical protein